MKRSVVLLAAVAAACALPSPARADARVSFELGGVYAYSPLGDASTEGTRTINSTSGASPSTALPAHDGIVGFELRPVFTLPSGARIGFDFRGGRTGGLGGAGAGSDVSVVGGGVSLGFTRRWGRLLPYAEAAFGFNQYGIVQGERGPLDPMQLRLDAVVGAKLYVTPAVYFVASAFAGWGDRYGGTVAVGFDIVHYRNRGRLP